MFLVAFCSIFFFIATLNSAKLSVANISNPWPRSVSDDRVRIITQSCNYQHYEQNTLWSYMVVAEPDLITLLGDSIYLDAKPCNEAKENCKTMVDSVCTISDCYKAKDLSCFNYCWSATTWYTDPYEEYNFLLNSSQFTLNKDYDGYNWPVPVIAIWDDHDYCKDNANGTCQYKELTKDAFVYFFTEIDQTQTFTTQIEEIADNDNGIYYYYDYNKTLTAQDGTTKTLKARFYNLDVRWHRTETNILGRKQQMWFENLLFNTSIDDIDYHIVCSGSVYYPTFGLGSYFAEPWPTKSKQWFHNVTSLAGIRDRLIILTGDVHYSAIYRDNKTFEIVTSAMTHGIYDIQAKYLQSVQKNDGYLKTDIINTENIGILDLGINGFEFIYINDQGEALINFTYNYDTDEMYYDNTDAGFRFFNTNWISILTIYLIFFFAF